MRLLFAALSLCLLVPSIVEARPSRYPPVTQFNGDRYVSVAQGGTAAPDVLKAVKRKTGAKARHPTRHKKPRRRPAVEPGVVAPLAARKSLFRGLVDEAAMAAGVPRQIAHAVIRVESGYNARARSPSGALGIGQILYRTARSMGYGGHPSGLYEPRTNLRYSMKYLALALRKGGHGCAGISLYERGIHARPRCTRYAQLVLARM